MIDINCDMGEGLPSEVERELLRYVTSANIACGGHAGDDTTMRTTFDLASAAGVRAGAHPSYPDRDQFGRREVRMDGGELEASIAAQVASFSRIAGPRMTHIKPHGALYNLAARNEMIARWVGKASLRFGVPLVGLAGSLALDVWRDLGLQVLAEGFADRRYERDGTLRARHHSDALIVDPQEAARQALELAGRVDTVCIHGDTPGAVAIARVVRERLTAAGLALG